MDYLPITKELATVFQSSTVIIHFLYYILYYLIQKEPPLKTDFFIMLVTNP